jgi:hypothetical protein
MFAPWILSYEPSDNLGNSRGAEKRVSQTRFPAIIYYMRDIRQCRNIPAGCVSWVKVLRSQPGGGPEWKLRPSSNQRMAVI